MLCSFTFPPYYLEGWLQPPQGVERYISPSHPFTEFFTSVRFTERCSVRNTGWIRQQNLQSHGTNFGNRREKQYTRQIYKDGLRLLNVTKKLKQGTATKQELHYTGWLGETSGGGEIQNLSNRGANHVLGKNIPGRGNNWGKKSWSVWAMQLEQSEWGREQQMIRTRGKQGT